MNRFGDSREQQKPAQEFDYNVAMRRLIYVVAAGCALIAGYSARSGDGGLTKFLGVTAVGLMTAGAALLSGGLLGFLFGVPHTREDGTGAGNKEPRGNEGRQTGSSVSTSYRANTSLEQISDWLSKMIVGVSLVEIKVIPGKLKEFAAYISKGLGQGESEEVFALTILLYFAVCGFVFGFLWARLYLARWFRQADELQILGEKITQLEKKQQADARALAVISQLNRQVDDPPLGEAEVADMIRAASSPVRSQIFAQAEKTSANTDVDNYDLKNEAVVSILKGLVASDVGDRYHRNHSELSYAYRRQKPPNWPKAEEEITKAIEIRDKLGKQGWRYYEFHRARCRIEQDPNFKKKTKSEPAFVVKILADLGDAYSDTDRWLKWYTPESSVRKWMDINEIDITGLQRA